MLRNIPNKYTQNSLLEEIDAAGFAETYDFFYLPMDVHNRANVGYAFVNFLKPEDMARFTGAFTDYVFQKHPSLKIARVSPAHIQGLIENLRHFSNRAVTWSRNSQYRPIVKYQGRHRDLSELLSELPLPAGGDEELGGRDEPQSREAEAPAPRERAAFGGFNPEAAEFVPRAPGQGDSAAARSTMRPEAGVFVPQAAMAGMPEEYAVPEAELLLPPGLEHDDDALSAPPGIVEYEYDALAMEYEACAYDGLLESYAGIGYDALGYDVALQGFGSIAEEYEIPAALTEEVVLDFVRPEVRTEVRPEALEVRPEAEPVAEFESGEPVFIRPPQPPSSDGASGSFTLAKMGLQDVLSKWLKEEVGVGGSSSSTRSSSNGTPRSPRTPEDAEPAHVEVP